MQATPNAVTITKTIPGNCSTTGLPVNSSPSALAPNAAPPPPPPPPAPCTPDTTTSYTAFQYTLTVAAPPDGNKAPPTYYWLHVLDQGGYTESGSWRPGKWVPAVKAPSLRVTRANGVVSAAVQAAKITLFDIPGATFGTTGETGYTTGKGGKKRWWQRRTTTPGTVKGKVAKWWKKWFYKG